MYMHAQLSGRIYDVTDEPTKLVEKSPLCSRHAKSTWTNIYYLHSYHQLEVLSTLPTTQHVSTFISDTEKQTNVRHP